MSNDIKIAQNRLYGDRGLKVADFKMFPGTRRDVSPEEIASEFNKVIAQLEADDFDVVEYVHEGK